MDKTETSDIPGDAYDADSEGNCLDDPNSIQTELCQNLTETISSHNLLTHSLTPIPSLTDRTISISRNTNSLTGDYEYGTENINDNCQYTNWTTRSFCTSTDDMISSGIFDTDVEDVRKGEVDSLLEKSTTTKEDSINKWQDISSSELLDVNDENYIPYNKPRKFADSSTEEEEDKPRKARHPKLRKNERPDSSEEGASSYPSTCHNSYFGDSSDETNEEDIYVIKETSINTPSSESDELMFNTSKVSATSGTQKEAEGDYIPTNTSIHGNSTLNTSTVTAASGARKDGSSVNDCASITLEPSKDAFIEEKYSIHRALMLNNPTCFASLGVLKYPCIQEDALISKKSSNQVPLILNASKGPAFLGTQKDVCRNSSKFSNVTDYVNLGSRKETCIVEDAIISEDSSTHDAPAVNTSTISAKIEVSRNACITEDVPIPKISAINDPSLKTTEISVNLELKKEARICKNPSIYADSELNISKDTATFNLKKQLYISKESLIHDDSMLNTSVSDTARVRRNSCVSKRAMIPKKCSVQGPSSLNDSKVSASFEVEQTLQDSATLESKEEAYILKNSPTNNASILNKPTKLATVGVEKNARKSESSKFLVSAALETRKELYMCESKLNASTDSACIVEDAWISEDSSIHGASIVSSSTVFENAEVRKNACTTEDARIPENSSFHRDSKVYSTFRNKEVARIPKSSSVHDDLTQFTVSASPGTRTDSAVKDACITPKPSVHGVNNSEVSATVRAEKDGYIVDDQFICRNCLIRNAEKLRTSMHPATGETKDSSTQTDVFFSTSTVSATLGDSSMATCSSGSSPSDTTFDVYPVEEDSIMEHNQVARKYCLPYGKVICCCHIEAQVQRKHGTSIMVCRTGSCHKFNTELYNTLPQKCWYSIKDLSGYKKMCKVYYDFVNLPDPNQEEIFREADYKLKVTYPHFWVHLSEKYKTFVTDENYRKERKCKIGVVESCQRLLTELQFFSQHYQLELGHIEDDIILSVDHRHLHNDFEMSCEFMMKEYPTLFMCLMMKFNFEKFARKRLIIDENRMRYIEYAKKCHHILEDLNRTYYNESLEKIKQNKKS